MKSVTTLKALTRCALFNVALLLRNPEDFVGIMGIQRFVVRQSVRCSGVIR
jgi:hypothetical protein